MVFVQQISLLYINSFENIGIVTLYNEVTC